MSRSGLARLFTGNTTERVLDKLDCDVLVVKPGTFRSSVEPGRLGAELDEPCTGIARRPTASASVCTPRR